MSAILALWRRDGAPVDKDTVEPMLAASGQRAVNGQQIWCKGSIALAHQHFWVTPEEQGERQPLVWHGGRHAIAFDGRLDNRSELIRALGVESPAAHPLSDAALTLHAYVRWQEASAERLLGDFAFTIWDEACDHLFIVRDPLGVRTVCFYCDHRLCVVASTAAQILAHPALRFRLNRGKIAEYLVRYRRNQDEAYYEGIFQCAPAHCVLVGPTNVRKWRYWSPDLTRRVRYRHEQEYAEEFRAHFTEAVRARLRFAGQAGVTLSGGMDSTSVAAEVHGELAAQGRLPGQGLRTYSFVFDRVPECDERRYSRSLVAMYDLNDSYLVADDVPILSGATIPFLSPDNIVYIGTTPLFWHLMRQMREDGCTVMLGGGFGDGLFERQPYWALDLLLDGRWGELFSATVRKEAGWGAWVGVGKALLKRRIPPAWLAQRQRKAQRAFWVETGVTPELIDSTDLEARVRRREVSRPPGRPGQFEHLQMVTWDYYGPLMAAVADGANSLGLEFWEPFRDRRLVEYALALPAYEQGRPRQGQTKRVLRAAMATRLPASVLARPDKTFFDPWVEARFWQREWSSVRHVLQAPRVVADGYVRQEWLAQRLAAQERSPHRDRFLWDCLMLELWLQRFGSDGAKMEPVPAKAAPATSPGFRHSHDLLS